MSSKQRERILMAAAGGLVLLLGAQFAFQKYTTARQFRQAQIDALRDQISERELVSARGARAADRIAEWERRSLPADLELANARYGEWLLGLVRDARLQRPNVESTRHLAVSQTVGGKNEVIYHVLPFSVRGRGKVEDVTRLLYQIYRAKHLHQVQRLSLKPTEKEGELDINLSLEALVLPTADRLEKLAEGTSSLLAQTEIDAYLDEIGKRNMFVEYKPPPPPPRERPRPTPTPPPPVRPSPPPFDTSKYTILTAIIEIDREPQVWLRVRTTGQLVKLREGDPIEIGQFKGRLIRVGLRDVLVENDQGRQMVVALGESLRPQFDDGI